MPTDDDDDSTHTRASLCFFNMFNDRIIRLRIQQHDNGTINNRFDVRYLIYGDFMKASAPEDTDLILYDH